MKIILKFISVILFITSEIYSQDVSQWENCTEGLEGVPMFVPIYTFENVLYLRSQKNTFYSTNLGINWIPFKQYDSNFNSKIYKSIAFINKYKNVYILSNVYGHYISTDKQNWQELKYKLPNVKTDNTNLDNINLITTDSTIILRVVWYEKIDSTKFLEHKRTCIAKGIGNDIYETYKFDTIPAVNDYITTDQEKYFDYLNIDGVIYSVYHTSKGGYFRYYYYSTDDGESWAKKEISNIEGGIKTLVKINNQIWIISPFALWRPKEDGIYEKIQDTQFDRFNTDFLCEHKGMIYAQAIDSSNHKPILIRSLDNGLTWEKVGNQYFEIRQLFSINGELIASSYKGILASIDDGESWEERQQGLYNSPDYYYEGPWKKIINIGENECITAPRNGLYNVMMKSNDGGKTWQRKYVIDSIGYTEYDWSGELYNFTFSSSKYGLFAADRGSNKIYKSYDKGETWEFYSNVAVFYKDEDKKMYERNDTLFYFNDDPYFQKDKFIYYSLDTGKIWEMYDSLFLKKLPEKSSFLFVRDGEYYAINQDNLTLYQSTNHGHNWTEVLKFQIPDTGKYTLFNFIQIQEKNLYFFTKSADNSIYITSDGGESWNIMKLPIPVYPKKWVEINGNLFIFYQDEYGELTYKYKKDVRLWVTRDLGQNWECLSADFDGNIVTDIMPVDNYLYISTYEGLFRTKINPLTVQENTEKTTLLPIELYPNPVIDEVKILNNYYTIEQITIYDMLGREVTKPFFTEDNFVLKDIKQGFYFVKLTFEGGWSVYRKIIKQ